ncbi:SphA family protein [Chromobacterium violaceum]|uniref:SphA family protein n=1 Tax=Chromobacterium violaceum TaxID=536 RepID=UPI003CF7B36D
MTVSDSGAYAGYAVSGGSPRERGIRPTRNRPGIPAKPRVPPQCQNSENIQGTRFNTILVPGQLSWTLPNNLHLKASLAVYLPTGSSSPRRLPNGTYLGAANGFWTLQPGLALSWLRNGWNLSMDATYAYNFRNPDTQYKSGQQLAIDYTVAKTIGKWTIGVGRYQENQLSDDSGSGAAACAQTGGCRASNYGIGPLLGYQLGKVKLMAIYNHGFRTTSDVGGDSFNLRLSFPFQ